MVIMTTNHAAEFPSDLPVEAFTFGRTATATRVHLAECPHLVGKEWHEATELELDRYPLCDWSQKELSGLGRSHPATVAEAMREQGTPAGAAPLIKEALKFVTFDEIWLPYSRSYVALGLDGRAVASFGKTYVKVAGNRVDLPGYVAGWHQGHTKQAAYGEVCPQHHIAMSISGLCDLCE